MPLPNITKRDRRRLSPWVELVTKEIDHGGERGLQTYHAFATGDSAVVLARTPAGTIPLVRQFRPAVERFTWELPAGLVDPGETPAVAIARELAEETGYETRSLVPLGELWPAPMRVECTLHVFLAEVGGPSAGYVPEPGVEVDCVTPDELRTRIRHGAVPSSHVAALLLAQEHPAGAWLRTAP